METFLAILPWGIGILAAIALLALLMSGYVKAPPDQAYIISGFYKEPRILIGKAGVKIPFLERLDKLALGAIQIDVKTANPVPTAEYINVRVDSTVSVKIGQTPEMIALAAKNFLNVDRTEISRKVNDLLEGNVREIVGSMKLTEMVGDRKAFGEKVQENAVPDLAKFGLELISFNVQNFSDDNDVIVNLGIDNVEQIRKKASIAKSDAQREVAIAEAENAKQANDAKVKAAQEIARMNTDLEIKKAEFKREADTKLAEAEAAKAIEAENQRKTREVAAAEADIARTERETELKRQEIELKERELDALVRKQADADKYAAQKRAEAELIKRQKEAEAKAYEIEQQAKALKVKAEAEKEAALLQAEGIKAVGAAEAEAIEKKAEAQKKMGDASVLEMYFNMLPQAIASAAAPLEKVDKITMYGEGNGAKLISDVMNTTNQVVEGVKESTGLDLTQVISSMVGANMAVNK